MALIQFTRSAGTASWIDDATGLPETDKVQPAQTVQRLFLTGKAGFRFANFMEVLVSYDTVKKTIVSHSFTKDSGIYTSPSFAKIPSYRFESIQKVDLGRDFITFTQIVGARTQSPEKIGAIAGSIVDGLFGTAGAGRELGERAAHAISGFPPIWSEIQIKIYNDGCAEASLLRHSIFPSLTFYKPSLIAVGGATNESGLYTRTLIGSGNYYNAVPQLNRWQKEGWGPLKGGGPGPVAGNPWGREK